MKINERAPNKLTPFGWETRLQKFVDAQIITLFSLIISSIENMKRDKA